MWNKPQGRNLHMFPPSRGTLSRAGDYRNSVPIKWREFAYRRSKFLKVQVMYVAVFSSPGSVFHKRGG